ncbi:glycosyltransferase [Thalassotalea sp. 1_MG-2023]|uniref:glycosyltransferase n=1 Tax=Thalassotalea sp. 1_MG-2023 TaxID=3062680 RepID=UPI0026E2781E|nr:glycosyltransferase [Thalassotalea sp. 1_MG-2023]MDO6426511.1 glycosyltransferase [Thalassotalea sp. 1_MG-2023]
MKLAFISPGSVNHTVKWVNSLSEKGIDVTLITQHRVESRLRPSVTVKYLPFSGTLGYFLNAILLRRMISKLQPDVVNVHYATGYGTLAMLSGISPYILSVWGSDVYEYPYLSSFKGWLTRKSLLSADQIASTSHDMARQVLKLVEDYPKDIAITPFGVDLSKFYSTRDPFSSAEITIGIVKTLEHKYGIDLLIEAFSSLEKYFCYRNIPITLKLMIVGGGELKEVLSAQVDKLLIDSQVEFVGKVPNDSVPKYINEMDIFVVPSRIESFGVSAVEALACERVCIVADTGGLPEVITDGETGLVVKPESSEEISNALIVLIEDIEKSKSFGKAGRKDVLNRFSEVSTVETMISLYQDFSENHA